MNDDQDQIIRYCLFCNSKGSFNIEHIIPESLGNDEHILENDVCCACNKHFSQIEEYVLQKTPLAFWRTFLGIVTKKGKLPTVDMAQPRTNKGIFNQTHPSHNNIAFQAHDDGSTSISFESLSTLESGKVKIVFTEKMLFMLSRFFCKVGIEFVCLDSHKFARLNEFAKARLFARNGQFEGKSWPIFHYDFGNIKDFKKYREQNGELLMDSQCYEYSLFKLKNYIFFKFSMGTDNFLICLNDPFPDPRFTQAFPEHKFNLLY